MQRCLVPLSAAGAAVLAAAMVHRAQGAPAPLDSSQDPCRLVSRGEAAALLGSAELLIVGDTATFERGRGDHEFKSCTYHSDRLGLEVKRSTYPSATLAATSMTEKSVPYLLPGADSVVAAPGLGERAYWVSGKNPFDRTAFGAYYILSGRDVLTLWLGGEGFTSPSAHREALRKLTETAIRRL